MSPTEELPPPEGGVGSRAETILQKSALAICRAAAKWGAGLDQGIGTGGFGNPQPVHFSSTFVTYGDIPQRHSILTPPHY
jgi:hypothetical protein